jgi:hypothetical protein
VRLALPKEYSTMKMPKWVEFLGGCMVFAVLLGLLLYVASLGH